MHPHTIEEMLDVLGPVLKEVAKAKQRFEEFWSEKIAIIWTTEDVHRAANERDLALTENEARQVLRYMCDHHNAQYGLKWADITAHIEDCVLGRKLTKRELSRFIHKDIITIQKASRSKLR
jgi:hypothetical protein